MYKHQKYAILAGENDGNLHFSSRLDFGASTPPGRHDSATGGGTVLASLHAQNRVSEAMWVWNNFRSFSPADIAYF